MAPKAAPPISFWAICVAAAAAPLNARVEELGEEPPVLEATPLIVVVVAGIESGGTTVDKPVELDSPTGLDATVEVNTPVVLATTEPDDSALEVDSIVAVGATEDADVDSATVVVDAATDDEDERAAQISAVTWRVVETSAAVQELTTQDVDADWIADMFAGSHWQAVSATLQVVAEEMAAKIQG